MSEASQNKSFAEVPRLDAWEKATGKAVYITDLTISGMAHARVVRSPVPHARITALRTEKAAKVPDVICTLTYHDISDVNARFGPVFRDTPILAVNEVRYVGEPLAVVVAQGVAAAEEACALVEAEFEELPGVFSIDEALAPGAPLVQEELQESGHFRDLSSLNPIPGTNVCHYFRYEQGDVDAAFLQADELFDDIFTVPPVFHYSMEPHAAIGLWSGSSITAWSSTQNPSIVRRELSQIFGVPLSSVEVIVPYVGGAFGSKCYTRLEPLVVAASRKAGRPVRLALSVEEACKTIIRHGAKCRIRTAVKKNGTILGRWCQVDLDTGAYADLGPRVAQKAGYMASGPYRIPHLRLEARAVLTNKVPAGAYRGYGVPQVTWASECQLDTIADRLGIDAVELRLRNFYQKGEEIRPGDRLLDSDLHLGLERIAEEIGWYQKTQGNLAGKGVSCGLKVGGGTHTVSTAIMRLHSDGCTSVLVGSVEHGQGAKTALAIIASKALDVPFEKVFVVTSGSGFLPYDQGSSGSRTVAVTGRAVQEAAESVRRQLLEAAAERLGAEPEKLRTEDGYVLAGENRYPYGWVVSEHFGMPGGELIGWGVFRPEKFEGPLGGTTTFWEMGMGGAEVKVDVETGEIEVLSYVSLADAGWVVNRNASEGQDEGAAMMAIGHTLFEELKWENGQPLNSNLIDYRVPQFRNLPKGFWTILLENGDGPGPFGAKGVGESGVFGVAPAIANAVRRAAGVQIRDLPLTPENVWRALKQVQKKDPRWGEDGREIRPSIGRDSRHCYRIRR